MTSNNPAARMYDVTTPTFSTMIIEWLDGLETKEQVRVMKLLGVPGDRREAYLEALHSATPSEVAIRAIEAPPQVLEITPTMAIDGSPSNKQRPLPVGNRDLLAHPTVDLTKRNQGLPMKGFNDDKDKLPKAPTKRFYTNEVKKELQEP